MYTYNAQNYVIHGNIIACRYEHDCTVVLWLVVVVTTSITCCDACTCVFLLFNAASNCSTDGLVGKETMG